MIPTVANVGKQMPEPDYKTTRNKRPGLLLNVTVIAWLSIMTMPCAALAAGLPAAAESPAAVQVDCHGAHEVVESTESECCCDPLAVTGGEALKSQRADLVTAILAGSPPMPTEAHLTSPERVHPPPQSGSRHPVYLTTQRLRI